MINWIIGWFVGLGLGEFLTFNSFEETTIGRFLNLIPNILGVFQSVWTIISFIPPIYLIIIVVGVISLIALRIVGR